MIKYRLKMPQDRIKRMDEKDLNYSLKSGDRCLAKWYQDHLWYKAKIITVNLMKNKTLYTIKFDNYPDETHNVTKENVVPYISKLDSFHELNQNEKEMIHDFSGCITDFGNKNMVELTCKEFGKWQQYTKGIGLKYLTKFGYEYGKGIGKYKQGRSDPVPIKKIKKNCGLDFINENIENHTGKTKKVKLNENNDNNKNNPNKRKRKNVFQTMNKIFNANHRPKKRKKMDTNNDNKLQRISELLFSLEGEKNLYQKKLLNSTNATVRKHYHELIKKHEMKIKQLKAKQTQTECNRNQDSKYEMENFKF